MLCYSWFLPTSSHLSPVPLLLTQLYSCLSPEHDRPTGLCAFVLIMCTDGSASLPPSRLLLDQTKPSNNFHGEPIPTLLPSTPPVFIRCPLCSHSILGTPDHSICHPDVSSIWEFLEGKDHVFLVSVSEALNRVLSTQEGDEWMDGWDERAW